MDGEKATAFVQVQELRPLSPESIHIVAGARRKGEHPATMMICGQPEDN